MNKMIFFASISLLFALALISENALAQPQSPKGFRWEKVEELSDEFNSWDNTKWTKPLWNYGVPVQMVAENAGVSDGKLWIKATLNEGAERWFQSSRVMSKMKIKFPMYTECNMRSSDISAYSTYWLNNGNSNSRDEIDICENNSNPSIKSQKNTRPYTMYSQYFVVKDGKTERAHGNFDNRKLSDSNPMKGKKWNEQFHTLGAWWIDEHTVQFYINGEEAGRVESKQPFTLEQNIIWDLWSSSDSWVGGLPKQEELHNDKINTMYVDWIHTYRLVKGKEKKSKK